ncbi:bifunctional 2-C-methyl-D-erythritol 4-phosphate cytidylyltransferase/2-C-methyl-D-erythritol 2,4-cyclodiphosphate synthase [Sphingomonas sinipercae]|uniref:Bifunctional enzyme IspD/IspF n=1 Tax=Sphingomonas sinipercae TaxID=2714944 RepID=A0A6G7ZNL5_9SPHN|nr:bifunctional 2-C-methyl-D-erythritol 4-phosphate cytidylyltransferase/2-C-methyl-D-erythritol 2,4-cyclodiphosphate synthase [Sphingomonas sinipercae]QIL02496.1 bifunctional 2-C-methyl-D-erythritol 4-phosphate cytidylyltransferase/2-C-methyl-D-erythritol 2,4-cyclodiphosphate synthase [Sphingomonas sinipercae]
MTTTALIVAAGSGTRLGGGLPKQYRAIAGKPVLRWAVEALAEHPAIAGVRVVVGPGQHGLAAAALAGLDVGPFIEGGAERADSVQAGLSAIDGDAVLVHDAARPFCPAAVIDRLLAPLEFFEGAAPVLAVGDTLARADGELRDTVPRDGIVRIQTPQAFQLPALRQAYEEWSGDPPTDETTVIRSAGMRVATVEGNPMLDKLTTAADWKRAEAAITGRLVPRTGMGFDVHAFAGPGPITLGGIAIDSDRGLAGHSDADVVLHAITDALLGAAAMGDIGQHFPPSDPQWKGAASDRFLAFAAEQVRARGGVIDHVDCTVICEFPKVGPHRERIRAKVADILGICGDDVSIKATTTERLGFTGRGEGIAAQAVVNIRMGRSEQ